MQLRQILVVASLLGLVSASFAVRAESSVASSMQEAVRHLRDGDGQAAVRLWRPLAEKGNTDAAYNLGMVYQHGDGVAKDETEAVKWFRVAAEKGDRQAQQQLGVMILHGRGVPADPVEANRWINRKHYEHIEHAHHMEGERQRAAQILWREEMQANLRRNRDGSALQMVAELRRRAGLDRPNTELAAVATAAESPLR